MEDREGFDDEGVGDGLLHVHLLLVHINDLKNTDETYMVQILKKCVFQGRSQCFLSNQMSNCSTFKVNFIRIFLSIRKAVMTPIEPIK